MAQFEIPVQEPVEPNAAAVARVKPSGGSDTPSPDSLSGYLPGWVRGRTWTAASGKQTQSLRLALPAFYACATQTAAYKYENDDATFVERLWDGTIIAGIFDGVTIPKRNTRAGHAVSTFIREKLRATLVEVDGRRPVIEECLASAIEEAVGVLDGLGGGGATTATVLVAEPMRTRDWRLYVLNAGNSRATVFLPDGTLVPITRIKPAGTSFAAVNTLTAGYRYKREASKATTPAGTIALMTSDGVHDHVADTDVWTDLGRAVEATLRRPEPSVERLVRTFMEGVVRRATAAQDEAKRPDDTTALALLLGDPTEAFAQKLQ